MALADGLGSGETADMTSARLRRTSNGLRRRRRQSNQPILFAGGGLALALAAALSVASFSDVDLVGAAAAKAQSIADILRQRSPGERTQARLAKTKRRYQVLAERELPEIPALAVYTSPVQLMAPPIQPSLALAAPVIPALASFGPPPPFFFIPPVGGVFAPLPGGGGGGGGGGSPGTTGPGSQPPGQPNPTGSPETPAVPEPGTWATMMMGFVLSGCMLRRRRARARQLRNA
jgi:hypothetical protein